MLTVFEKIPVLFVEMYDAQFGVWAQEFRKRGAKQAIEFAPVPGVPRILDAEGRPVQKGARFEAEVDRSGGEIRVVIRPASEHDEEMIARHVSEMKRFRLQ